MLCDTIKEIRKKHYLNQAAFAKMIGVTQSAVSQWENDLTRPNSYQLEAIANTFGISIDELLVDKITENAAGIPRTPEAKILAEGIDRLPKEQREQALEVMRAVFATHADYFMKKGDNSDDS